jgi:hypothetical protein
MIGHFSKADQYSSRYRELKVEGCFWEQCFNFKNLYLDEY